jgi:hypothetical protein
MHRYEEAVYSITAETPAVQSSLRALERRRAEKNNMRLGSKELELRMLQSLHKKLPVFPEDIELDKLFQGGYFLGENGEMRVARL